MTCLQLRSEERCSREEGETTYRRVGTRGRVFAVLLVDEASVASWAAPLWSHIDLRGRQG
jgi:hypothetical protein